MWLFGNSIIIILCFHTAWTILKINSIKNNQTGKLIPLGINWVKDYTYMEKGLWTTSWKISPGV